MTSAAIHIQHASADRRPLHMKIAIVTVFNDLLNYGSYLQAFATQEFLRARGHTTRLVEIRSWQRSYRKYRALLTKDTAWLVFNLKRFSVYAAANSKLDSAAYDARDPYDAVLLGSDEIWNLKNATFDHSLIFFGAGFNSQRIIAYAPSANGMTHEDFADLHAEREALKGIRFLSARDGRTAELVERVTGRAAQRVLDPTFLIDWKSYETAVHRKPFLLVYCYNATPDRRRDIEDLAATHALEVVYIGHYCDTDKTLLVSDPFEFLGLIRAARFVITDSFHGTIFSIQFNKQFVSYVGKNYKISSVLNEFSLDERNVEGRASLEMLYGIEIDYVPVNRVMRSRVLDSIKFIEDAIGHSNPSL